MAKNVEKKQTRIAVERLESRVSALKTKRAELENDLRNLLTRQAEANERLQAAAASDDEKAYLAATKELSEVSPLIAFKKEQLGLVEGVKIEKGFALEVWDECLKEYSRNFSSCMEAYSAELRRLWSLYLDMAALEAECSENRRHIAKLSGLELKELKLTPSLREMEESLLQGRSEMGRAIAGLEKSLRSAAIVKRTVDLNTFYRHGLVDEAAAEVVLPVVVDPVY